MNDDAKKIAEEIIRQLGGQNKLHAMIGACEFMVCNDPSTLRFRFKGCRKCNVCTVMYDAGYDQYNVTFYKSSLNGSLYMVRGIDGVFAENLKQTFEQFTGMYLSL